MNLHITRAFELFENNFVHSATRIDQSRSDDRQAPAVLDISRRAEKLFWLMKRIGIHATREDLSAGRYYGVIGARQSRDTIKENHDIFSMLDQTFSLLNHHFSDLDVPRRRFIKRRTDHLAIHRALHVGH